MRPSRSASRLLGPLVINIAGAAGRDPRRWRSCTSWPRSSASRCRPRRRRPGPTRARTVRRRTRRRRSRPPSPSSARALGFIRAQPLHQLVAAVPGHHRVAGRRARRAGPGLRREGPRPQAQGLRGDRAAARWRHRDGHPAAQLVRQVPAPPARHRGRPDHPRRDARAAVGRRPDQPAPAAGGRPERLSTCRR